MVRATEPKKYESIARAQTVPALFLARAQATPEARGYQYPTAAGWRDLSWREAEVRVRAIANGLLSLGIKPEQRCAILSSTRIEWILVDLGIGCAGGATTTLYPSNTADECAFILADSGSVMVFAENDQQVEKLRSRRDQIPGVFRVVTLDGHGSDDGWVIPLPAFEEQGRNFEREHPTAVDESVAQVQPGMLSTLIYTSGTTGQPKGVELTHDCWIYEAEAVDAVHAIDENDVHYLWLPLAHSFGKVIEMAQLRIGFTNAVDGRVDRIAENLTLVNPTFVCAVPRVFEKLAKKVITTVHGGSRIRSHLFDWAVSVGKRTATLRRQGEPVPERLRIEQRIADRLVFSKLRARFGNRLRFFLSGSAALPRDIAEFFNAAGVEIYEGYGLTETSAASCSGFPGAYRFGSVGRPLPGTEVKIAEPDGEILLRGRGIMRAYHGLPLATRETLEPDGWLHTGDIGHVDDDGYVYVTDRKKDLIKTSGGKYVAPQMLENRVKGVCPYISQVVAHGDGRNYVSALVTLDAEAIRQWAADNGLAQAPLGELANHPSVRALVAECVDHVNKNLPSYATIKKFTILADDLTMERGELTANLKVKRKVVEAHYRAVFDAMYETTTPG